MKHERVATPEIVKNRVCGEVHVVSVRCKVSEWSLEACDHLRFVELSNVCFHYRNNICNQLHELEKKLNIRSLLMWNFYNRLTTSNNILIFFMNISHWKPYYLSRKTNFHTRALFSKTYFEIHFIIKHLYRYFYKIK